MMLRIIDERGNKLDCEMESVPRIGERIVREFRAGSEPLREHFFRVIDVTYRIDEPKYQVMILVEEAHDAKPWPS